jgi:hypothetical protein
MRDGLVVNHGLLVLSSCDNAAILPDILDQAVDVRVVANGLCVAYNADKDSGPCDGDIHASRISKEPVHAFGICPDQAQQDRLLLAALESIHGLGFESMKV